MRLSALRGYTEEAGYAKVDVSPMESPFWRFYRLAR